MRDKEVYGRDSHDFYTKNRAKWGYSKGLRTPPTGGRMEKEKGGILPMIYILQVGYQSKKK